MTPTDTSSGTKKPLPPAMAAAARLYAFKPGHAGAVLCEAMTNKGAPCRQIAVKGLFNKRGQNVCRIHGRVALEYLRKRGRPRCEALNVKRPRKRCEHPAVRHGFCGHHALRYEAGRNVERVPERERGKAFVPMRNGNTSARAIHRGKFDAPPRTAQALRARVHAAPRELTSTQAWRDARGSERAALVHAWEVRDTSPEAWRNAVRAIMTREAE